MEVGGNSPGTKAVYCAGTRSLAILEMLVHLDLKTQLPTDRVMVKIEIPEFLEVQYLNVQDLHNSWYDLPYGGQSQQIFDHFVADDAGSVLAVPSVIVPQEWNYILSPLHDQFKTISILEIVNLDLDERLFP